MAEFESKLTEISKDMQEKTDEIDEIVRDKKVTQEKLDSFKAKNNVPIFDYI